MSRAIRKLIMKVEMQRVEDKFDPDFERAILPITGSMKEVYLASDAYHGSMDAALALHDAVFPDEGWEVYRTSKYPGMMPGSWPSPYAAKVGWGTQFAGHADTPARAWLLAILGALEARDSTITPARVAEGE